MSKFALIDSYIFSYINTKWDMTFVNDLFYLNHIRLSSRKIIIYLFIISTRRWSENHNINCHNLVSLIKVITCIHSSNCTACISIMWIMYYHITFKHYIVKTECLAWKFLSNRLTFHQLITGWWFKSLKTIMWVTCKRSLSSWNGGAGFDD